MPRRTLDDLLARIKQQRLEADPDLITLAYQFAERAHWGQRRRSGEPYLVHPLATAITLADLKLDEATIVAGLLHDVPEDTAVTIDQVEREFGKEVGTLVRGVTKLGALKYRGLERYVENLRKMFIAIAEDVRVIIVKFADRIHNLETLKWLPPEKRERIARESLEIYAPIANRLGMGELKGQLEDLAFPYLHPAEYRWTCRLISRRLRRLEQTLRRVRERLLKELRRAGIEVVDIHGRRKHFWSLYQKLQRPEYHHDIGKITDLVALRIIVKDVAACYATLGAIHKLWMPTHGKVKDYIAQPKPNGYRSIHTTVFTEHDELVEFQIRDTLMHEEAEFGVAAHWHYDESGKPKRGSRASPRKLAWIRELSEWKQEYQSDEQYLKALKIDVFSNRIFVFTPRGEVIDLPDRSTPVDFAFAVHTDLGRQLTGAKVNGKIVRVDTELRSGDVVEILRDKRRKRPNRDWLAFVKTHLARSEIRHDAKR